LNVILDEQIQISSTGEAMVIEESIQKIKDENQNPNLG